MNNSSKLLSDLIIELLTDDEAPQVGIQYTIVVNRLLTKPYNFALTCACNR